VIDIFAKHMVQMPAAKNQEMVQRFAADGSNAALGEGIRSGRR
jgi:hypothetical protein